MLLKIIAHCILPVAVTICSNVQGQLMQLNGGHRLLACGSMCHMYCDNIAASVVCCHL